MRELLADLNSVTCGVRSAAELCDICEVIAAASDAVSAATENHSVQILPEVPVRIELPLMRSRMECVFFNLIANALETMPTGGKLRILGRKARDCVLIELEDTGPGIRAEFATGCSNRSSQQASRAALGSGWPSPAGLFSSTAATFGRSPPPALVLSSAFPGSCVFR
jgi:K+-sensing histidine kinase KdpD